MDTQRPVILFGDPDLGWSRSLRARLRKRGFRVSTAGSARSLLECVEQDFPDVVILDEHLDEVGGGILIHIIRSRSPKTRIIRLIPADGPSLEDVYPEKEALPSFRKPAPEELLWEAITGANSCIGPPVGATSPLILCVDDDRLFLESISRILLRHGYRVLVYTDAERALQDLPLLKPDLLLVDILMPGMNGLELIDELRDYQERPVPIVLLSARDSDEEIQAGYRHGAACYLTKPCIPSILLDVVERLVRNPSNDGGPRPWRSSRTRRSEPTVTTHRKTRPSKDQGGQPA